MKKGCSLSIADTNAMLDFPLSGEEIKVESLSLRHCSSLRNLDWLAGNKTLKSLSIVRCDNLIDVATLATLTQLESVDLEGKQTGLVLPHLSQIKRLRIKDDYLTNLNCLQQMTDLESLDASCRKLDSFDAIKNLKKLNRVKLREPSRLNSFAFLDHLPLLRSVDLTGGYSHNDITGLLQRPKLEQLALHDFTSDDLKFSETLQNLTELELDDIKGLTNLDCLRELTYLRAIKIQDCADLTGLDALLHLPNLETISFIDCKSVTDTSVLVQLNQAVEITWDFMPFIPPQKPQSNQPSVSENRFIVENDNTFVIDNYPSPSKAGDTGNNSHSYFGPFHKALA